MQCIAFFYLTNRIFYYTVDISTNENYIKEEYQEEFLKLTKELIILSREEKGNISYHLYQDINDDSHFTFIEEWQNQEAIDEHNQTKHFTTIVPQIKSFASKPSRAIKYKEVQ